MSNEGERRTIEDWATAKDLLPEHRRVPATGIGGRRTTAKVQNPRFYLFAQVKMWKAWPEGAEVTEAEFDAAVVEVQGHPLR